MKNTQEIPNADEQNDTKRKHAKIPLQDLLKEATPQEGVHWIEPGKCFEINWNLFETFYHKRGGSTAKLESIRKRFNSKNRCQRERSDGYDDVYFSELIAKKTSKSSVILNKTSKSSVILEEGNLLMCLFEDHKEVHLMRVAQKLTETSNSSNDMNNMVYLLCYEVVEKKPNTSLNKEEIDCFLNRFGPLDLTLYNMRDFINSGANDWYHGNISRENSETILKENLKTNPSAFLIRAKSTPGNPVAFVISFGFSTTSFPPQIFHTQIFSIKNKLITLVQKYNKQEEKVLSSVIQILDVLDPKPQFAVPSSQFRFLENPTEAQSHICVPNPTYLVPNFKG